MDDVRVVADRIETAGRDHHHIGAHHAAFVDLRIGFGRDDEGFERAVIFDDLGQHAANAGDLAGAEHFRHQLGAGDEDLRLHLEAGQHVIMGKKRRLARDG
ncbi:hypothetical protein D3C71_1250510 [compost metagenome]